MKKSFADKFSDIALIPVRPIVLFFLNREIDVVHSGGVLKRKDPFMLISNHFNTWDSFVLMKNVKANIRFVATEIAWLDFSKKILLNHIARAIRKRVGKLDYSATKRIFKSIEDGYAIGLFPEGDNTYYGETVDIYQSTGKLLKKANLDVILVKQRGGYISQPRWADSFAKKGIIHTERMNLLTKEQLQNMTPEEINQVVEKALYNNDYDFQREVMHNFKRKNRAEGIERLIYRCNKCGSIMSVYGKGHDIVCHECGVIGTINEYEFIEHNKFDNLVDYNHEQYRYMEDVVNSTFHFPVTLNTFDSKKLRNNKIGSFELYYQDKILTLKNEKQEIIFDITKMKYGVCTMRHSFSFDYEDQAYNFTDIRHQFVIYEMLRYVNGSYKA
jgi:1-acyl-sn-glycerol-3-phosphate acyltransferase